MYLGKPVDTRPTGTPGEVLGVARNRQAPKLSTPTNTAARAIAIFRLAAPLLSAMTAAAGANNVTTKLMPHSPVNAASCNTGKSLS